MPAISASQDIAAVIETGRSPETTLLFIHGLGASGEAFIPLFNRIDFGGIGAMRIVLPNASPRAVSICDGQEVPAWFDLRNNDFRLDEDEVGLRMAAAFISGLIEREVAAGIPPWRIVVAGFSQGGALALMTSLLSKHELGGAAALSGWLPLADQLGTERTSTNPCVPVFIGHGENDLITPLPMADAARQQLLTWGHEVRSVTYPMGHTIIDQELSDLVVWMAEVLRGRVISAAAGRWFVEADAGIDQIALRASL
jgi:phospholipase/carboxylesterase